MTMNDKDLVKLATEASKNAYVPYSHFPVGAAVECEDGTVYTGCNVENSAYGSTICAERVAYTKAISEGHRKFKKVAVFGKSDTHCMPCGTCRQFMMEFKDVEVLCANKDGEYGNYRLKDLLAHAFEL